MDFIQIHPAFLQAPSKSDVNRKRIYHGTGVERKEVIERIFYLLLLLSLIQSYLTSFLLFISWIIVISIWFPIFSIYIYIYIYIYIWRERERARERERERESTEKCCCTDRTVDYLPLNKRVHAKERRNFVAIRNCNQTCQHINISFVVLSSKPVVFKVSGTLGVGWGRYELSEGRWRVNSRMGALKLWRGRWSNYSKMWRWCW